MRTAALALAAAFITVGFGCQTIPSVQLTEGVDASAGGGEAFIVTTETATYYLEKSGGGLSSLLDPDGVDWLGFHSEPGSGHKGEYRGFPNAVHKQDGNYFHAMNAGTDPSQSVITGQTDDRVTITVTSGNGAWEGVYDFHPDRLDFTMTRVSPGHRYWVQYEGVPGGTMDADDFRISSADPEPRPLSKPYEGDLPGPEWMAFGDADSPRMLFMLHHTDDTHPDDYAPREHMTVFAFGRRGKGKYLTRPGTVSIGLTDTADAEVIGQRMTRIVGERQPANP